VSYEEGDDDVTVLVVALVNKPVLFALQPAHALPFSLALCIIPMVAEKCELALTAPAS
jgi:hypothetical protein